VQLEFVLLSAMVSRHSAPIAARRDLVGSGGTFKLSRISAATILKLLNVGVRSHPPKVVSAGTLICIHCIGCVASVSSRSALNEFAPL
jgi:hypothetical protein